MVRREEDEGSLNGKRRFVDEMGTEEREWNLDEAKLKNVKKRWLMQYFGDICIYIKQGRQQIRHQMWRKQLRNRSEEEELIERIRNNDQRAMSELYNQYAGVMTSVCFRYLSQEEDVKDVLQESFICIFTSIGKFHPQHELSLKAWIKKIVVNHSIQYLQKRKRLTFIEQYDTLENDISNEESEEINEVTDDELHKLICQLPDGYRTVLNLFIFEGYSHKQISQMLGINERTSSSQLSRAKRLLSKSITDFIRRKQ